MPPPPNPLPCRTGHFLVRRVLRRMKHHHLLLPLPLPIQQQQHHNHHHQQQKIPPNPPLLQLAPSALAALLSGSSQPPHLQATPPPQTISTPISPSPYPPLQARALLNRIFVTALVLCLDQHSPLNPSRCRKPRHTPSVVGNTPTITLPPPPAPPPPTLPHHHSQAVLSHQQQQQRRRLFVIRLITIAILLLCLRFHPRISTLVPRLAQVRTLIR